MPSKDPAARVDDILHPVARIETYIARAGGIERRLMIISEAAVKLGPFAERLEPGVAWRDIRGLGNALRHAYDRVNPEIVRAILLTHLPLLAIACRRMKTALTPE